MKVFINPGHMPGVDPGAMNPNSGLKECDVALAVGKLVEYYLKNAGCEVMRLQSDNLNGESPAYPNVCKTANDWGADVFVSLHCNAFDGYARGIETLVFNFGGEAARLATCVHKQLVDTEQSIDPYIPDRGLRNVRICLCYETLRCRLFLSKWVLLITITMLFCWNINKMRLQRLLHVE
jgi:N-acetylmuramoyl-L-alanine amidase